MPYERAAELFFSALSIAGFILSFVVEWWPAYESMSSRAKRLVMMALCFVIPLVSLVGLILLGEVSLTADAVWLALVAGFSAFFGSQAADVRNQRGNVSMSFEDEGKILFDV